jgi:hypothetical protein
VLYFGNPSSPAIRQAMIAGDFGCITSPMQGNVIPDDAVWCADNGRFGKGWPGRATYLKWLAAHEYMADRCQFVLLPDVPFDMARSLDCSASYIADVAALGFPVALALQNGAENMNLPWADIDAVFIAGDTAWKLSPAAKDLSDQARQLGKWVHMGRVNTWRRLRYAAGIGCDSSDGTCFTRAPDKNLERISRWQATDRRRGVQTVLL